MHRFHTVISTFLCLASAANAASQPNKLNVLFLFSDDQRADTIAALGNQHVQTPNLDRLVKNGTTFTRAYCMGSQQGAVCVPSRAMVLTGRTLFRVQEQLKGQATWPEAFARAGYATFVSGKWHNGQPSLLRCFQLGKGVFFGGMGNPYDLPVSDVSPTHELVNKRKSGKHSVELFSDEVIGFLKSRPKDKPFFAYVPFNLPHDPRTAPKKFHDHYYSAKPPLPPNYLPQHPFNNGEMVVRDEKLAPWPRTKDVVQQHLADYYAAISFLDEQIGRILDTLASEGLANSTIIVFASDHGLAIGSHGLFGKQNLYEHSMRVPLIFAGPGIPKDQRKDAFAYLFDIYPTVGETCGVAAPDGSEGKSLAPVILGKAAGVRDSIFTAYRDVQRAVRDERFHLIVYPHINKVQMFDLASDPHETKDLAGERVFAPEVQRLTAMLRDWQSRLGDTQALTSAKPQPPEFDFSKVK
jgi:arylsulfatase A-like enzyme